MIFFGQNDVEVIAIKIVGSIYSNSQIGLIKNKEIKLAAVHPRYAECIGVISKKPSYN